MRAQVRAVLYRGPLGCAGSTGVVAGESLAPGVSASRVQDKAVRCRSPQLALSGRAGQRSVGSAACGGSCQDVGTSVIAEQASLMLRASARFGVLCCVVVHVA
mmetsp:Transcript_46275/g.122166  ORF Transcript_46275/g.122166 Transcript_46275/m.122166 type:complete len:103 (+) Transcript_46275:113-421(+)